MARVLIIDDSPTHTQIAVSLLKKHGHTYMTANCAVKGIEMAISEKPDLILMDVVMPDINGFQATRELSMRPETKAIPVVMVSTKDTRVDVVWGLQQGAQAYLTKPLQEKDLLGVMAEILGS